MLFLQPPFASTWWREKTAMEAHHCWMLELELELELERVQEPVQEPERLGLKSELQPRRLTSDWTCSTETEPCWDWAGPLALF